MLNSPDLPFLYLQNEKSNSYLLRVGEQLNEVIDVDYRASEPQLGAKMPRVQIPASICESLGTWLHLTMPPFPQLWNGYNKVPTSLNCCVIKWPSVLTECSEQCLVQGKNPASVSYLSVIRAWHKTYEQCVLVPLVLFSCSRFLNGLVKIRRVHFQINWHFLSKCWRMVTFKNSVLWFALLCFALLFMSALTTLCWNDLFLFCALLSPLSWQRDCFAYLHMPSP